jgi:predicted branched-subunit amino acid permease
MSSEVTIRKTLLAYLPVAFAIGVFGTIYGAAAAPLMGPRLTVATSAIVFSGALQFALLGMLHAGAASPALLATAVVLNLRHLLLGAAVRGRLAEGGLRRAVLAWFLVDETAGFALAAPERPALVLLTTGIASYLAWIVGTAVGVAGASLMALGPVASALFPILFIGLTGLSARRRDLLVRAAAAAGITLALVYLYPPARSVAALAAVLAVIVPGRDGR